MDVRSSSAKIISEAFDQGRMMQREGVLLDTDTNQIYCRTSANRLARIDLEIVQVNILTPDCLHFSAVRTLAPGETLLVGDGLPPLTRADLLPPLTFWQQTGDTIFAVGVVAVSFGLGYFVRGHMHHKPHDEDTVAHLTQAPHNVHQSGWVEHPAIAPNGCVLDGSDEATLRAMLPGHCPPHPTFLSGDFDWPSYDDDQHNEMPIGGPMGLWGPDAFDPVPEAPNIPWEEMTVAQKAVYGTACGVAAGIGSYVVGTLANEFAVKPALRALRRAQARRAEAFFAQHRTPATAPTAQREVNHGR